MVVLSVPKLGSYQKALGCLQAIKNLCREVGITRADTEIPLHKLDHHIRADLDSTSERVLAVLRPLKLVLTNLPEEYSQTVEAKVPKNLHLHRPWRHLAMAVLPSYSVRQPCTIWVGALFHQTGRAFCSGWLCERDAATHGYYGLVWADAGVPRQP